MLDPTKCQKCGKTLARSDEEFIEVTGVCERCVVDDKTEGKVYQTMFTEYMRESRAKVSSPVHCPKCEGDRGKILPPDSFFSHPHCEGCGGQWIDGKFRYVCHTCNKEVEELHGLFVRTQCKKCHDDLCQKNIKAGRVCRMCRQPINMCCC